MVALIKNFGRKTGCKYLNIPGRGLTYRVVILCAYFGVNKLVSFNVNLALDFVIIFKYERRQ